MTQNTQAATEKSGAVSGVNRDNKTFSPDEAKAQAHRVRKFLDWLTDGKLDQVFLCSVNRGGTGWSGGGVKDRVLGRAPDADHYYSLGIMPSGQVVPRREERAEGVWAAVLDDLGGKYPVGDLARELDNAGWVGAKIETSAGNFQWIMKYRDPVTGERGKTLHGFVQAGLAKLGLTDRLIDSVRLVRLPSGRNNKPGVGRDGFPVRLVEHDPDSNVCIMDLLWWVLDSLGENNLAELLSAEGLAWVGSVDGLPEEGWLSLKSELTRVLGDVAAAGAGVGAREYTGDVAHPDPWLRLIDEVSARKGWPMPEQVGDGLVDCRCPFGHEHSTDELIRYLGDGHFRCHHSSCQTAGRQVEDYRRELCRIWDDECRREDEPTGRLLVTQWMLENAESVENILATPGLMEAFDKITAETDFGSLRVEALSGDVSEAVSGETLSPELQALCDRFVLVALGKRGDIGWYDRDVGVMLSSRQMEADPAVMRVFGAGRSGAKSARAQLGVLVSAGRMDHAHGLGTDPTAPEGALFKDDRGRTLINLWAGTSVVEVPERPDAFLEHMEFLFGPKGSGSAQRDEVENLLAWIIQNPGRKTARTLMMVGGQGVGKDLVVDCMGQLVGVGNYRVVRDAELASGFNEFQQARLVHVAEVDMGGRYGLVDALKRLTGSSAGGFVDVNPKYEEKRRVRDLAQYVLTTNNKASLPVDANSRRDLIVECPSSPHPQGAKYYDRIAPLLKGLGDAGQKELGRVLWYLRTQVDLTGYNPDAPAPDTQIKQAVSRASHSDSVQTLLDGLEALDIGEDGLKGDGKALITARALSGALIHSQGLHKREVAPRALGKAMEVLGWEQCGKVITDHEGNRTRVWVHKSNKDDPDLHADGRDELASKRRKRRLKKIEDDLFGAVMKAADGL
jgi:hypothetical protein